jgi:hypothetical protein
VSKTDKKLLKSLKARGLRRSTARDVVRATSGATKSRAARRVVADLSSVVDEVSDRLRQGPEKRSAAAKKAARTRKRKMRARSEAAKRGARKRAGAR